MKIVRKNYLPLFIPLFIIMIISFFNMQNAKLIDSTYNYHLIKQLLWYFLGFLSIILINKLNLKKLLNYSFYFYLFSLILLGLVLIVGKDINGAKAWFNFGIFSFQPSELVKLTLSLYLSNIIANSKITNIKDEIKLIFKVFIIVLVPSILVFLEPDTGAIIFYLIIALCLLLSSKISKWWFLLLLFILTSMVILFIGLYKYNQDLLIKLIGTSFFYRVERLLTFTTNSSYQLENALIVIGSSTLFGSGLNKVTLYIPEAPTDFIFAFNIGNFGIISGFIILFCYLVIDLYLLKLLKEIKTKKIKLFLISFISIFFFQQIMNIGMSLGLVPIIGIPLPFLSYGGSTIIIYFIYLGIILNFLNSEGINIYR